MTKGLAPSSFNNCAFVATPPGGFTAIAAFLEKSVPQAEQQKAADVLLKILNGSMWELWQLARAQDKLPVVPNSAQSGTFLQQAINTLSDSFFYGAPVFLQLDEFKEIKASVFQMTRAPGKNIVYLGCLLLTLGVPWALKTYRQYRIESGQRPLLNDEQFQKLVETLSAVATAQTVRNATTDHSDAPSAPSRT